MWQGILFLFLATAPATAGSPLLYPNPRDGLSQNTPGVRVDFNGHSAFVYALMHVGRTYGGIFTVASDFTSFIWHNEAVEVSLNYIGVPANDIRVRRLHQEIPTKRVGDHFIFRIDRPGAYEVEINRDLRNRGPLVIFANMPDNWKIQRGDIVFPPGRVTDAGVIHVTKNNQRIYIPGGAVVRALLKIEGASDVQIGGHGVLLFDDKAAREFQNESDASPILAINTQGLALTDLTVMVSPTSFSSGPDKGPVAPWAVHIIRGTNVRITNLNIFNQLRDGLDIDGSEDVTVQGGFVQAHDDALCIKSTNYGPGGGAQDRPVKNVKFQKILVMNTGAGSALSIGKELHTSEIAYITYRDLDILHAVSPHGTAISIHNGDRANVHDIIYDNVLVNDRPGTLLDFSVETDGYRPDAIRGRINNVLLRNLRIAEGAVAPSRISGMDTQHTVSGIRFEGFRQGNNSQMGNRLDIDIDRAPLPVWVQNEQQRGGP